MAEIIFNLKGNKTTIKCNINDKMKDIIEKFLKLIESKDDHFYYFYNGIRINKELTFNEQANDLDKERKKLNILVYNFKDKQNNILKPISKDIKCPECGENCFIDFKNFKIKLYGCKNNHINDNILLYVYEDIIQDETKLLCDICKDKNKGDFPENLFYICYTCNKNICPLCKSNHDNNHIVINYADRNYICNEHNETFNKYCKECNKDICIKCVNQHINHDIFDLNKILIDENNMTETVKELKDLTDKFKNKVSEIKIKLKKRIMVIMVNMLITYYNINNNIIHNFNKDKQNYHVLKNMNTFKKNIENLINDLNDIIDDDKELYDYSINYFYNINGDKYIGNFKNGLKEGYGVLFYDEEDELERISYEGHFQNDKQNGEGTIYWINCNYEGDWKDGIIEGKGVMKYDNGAKYEGEWKNGKFEGKGILYDYNGDIYEGDWRNYRREGKGVEYYNDGDIYKGDFKNDIREGYGIIYYNDGERYEGEWKNDEKEGKGIMHWLNGSKYEGDWVYNRREGKGIEYYNNGDKYEGEWKNDEREGKGKFFYNNGNKYVGDFKNGVRDGKGIMYYSNGDAKEGYWKNDIYEGL